MKTWLIILAHLVIISISEQLHAQTLTPAGPGNAFDYVHDRFGNSYPLQHVAIGAGRPIGGQNSVTAVPSQTCSAGYFQLYFAPGSYYDNNTAAQTLLCQLFSDISNFINSPLTNPSINTTNYKINIYVDNEPTGALATASSLFLFPSSPSNPNSGIVDNLVYKAIQTGKDPYASIPMGVFANGPNFYCAYVKTNPAPPNGTWNLSINSPTIGANEYDLYSVMLHEVVHALGFATIFGANGFSQFGQNNNYFSRYDQFLTDANGTPLLATSSPSCSNSNLTYQSSLSPTVIAPGTCPGITPLTTCTSAVRYMSSSVNVPVNTPPCFGGGTSLSHFDDYCYTPTGYANSCSVSATPANTFNDMYFVMSDGAGKGTCGIKRYLKEEEKLVLCDMEYSVNATYSSYSGAAIDGASNTHTYNVVCSNTTIVGMNDGYVNGQFTYTTTGTSISIPTLQILANDSPSLILSMSCVENVYNNITQNVAFATVGSNLVVTANAGSGLVLLKYLPKDNNGRLGNATYIFLYFVHPDCNPPSACNIVQNGGFESSMPNSLQCGFFENNSVSDAGLSCWERYSPGGGRVFSRNCTYTQTPSGVVTNAFSIPVVVTNPNFDSHNGQPNDKMFLLDAFDSGLTPFAGVVKNNLSSPLIPGSVYQLSFWTYNPIKSYAPSAPPFVSVVVSVASEPSFAGPLNSTFPASGLNVIGDFTINPTATWSLVTKTFTFSPPVNALHQSLIIGINNNLTGSVSPGNISNHYIFLDDISLMPASSATFVMPSYANCTASYTNLAQYASPIPGVFSGPGVTSSTSGTVTTYNFNSPPVLQGGKYYSIAFTYTDNSGCSSTIWQNILVPGIAPGACDGGYTLSANGFTSGTTYLWMPGSTTSSTAFVQPFTTTVYTLQATSGACISTSTVSLAPCCSSGVGTFISNSILSGTVNGGVIYLDQTIPSGSMALLSGELLIAPEVKITVSNNATLQITDAHLYSCSEGLWKGIEVEDGGRVFTFKENIDNLIEDAVIAINSANNANTALPSILNLSYTTFNKNYIDINISNYSKAVGSYPFNIYGCVFTCRDLPFTSTSWPQTGESSPLSTTVADLRYVNTSITPTTGLASPYLNQTFSITPLKHPYTTQRSHIAIRLTNVGLTNTTNMYGINIGDNSIASNFNLFDAHGQFISAVNSNVISLNNVFQNTQTYTTATGNFGGAAISHSAGSTMNDELIMTATNKSLGSRFWNCHRGIEGRNIYKLDVQKATFRSTQSSTTPSFTSKGIEINTNRFDYYIAENEFTNQHTGINIPLAPGQFTTTGTSFTSATGGIYADKLRITENAFTGAVSGVANTYMEWAANVSGPFLNTWNVIPNVGVSPAVHALAMTINTVTNARNGLAANGIRTLPTISSDNVVTLQEGSGAAQYGMVLVNANPTNIGNVFWSKPGENAITNNTVNFSGALSTTNIPGALVYCDQIGYAAQSPSVTCNDISNGVQGFLYSGSSPGTIWAGNKMSILERGLVLSNGGVIGVQGGAMTAISNLWDGNWNTKSHTYVDGSSDAKYSRLFCRNAAGLTPTINTGPQVTQNYDFGPGYTITAVGSGDYNCYNMPNYKTISVPNNDDDFLSPELFYMQEVAFYNLVHINDSIRYSDGEFEEFHDAKAESSIGKFVAADEFLFAGDYNEALSALSEVNIDLNTVELNYLQFYTLYASYLENGSLSETEAGDLNDLAWLCPGTNGSSVFQARALYNALYHEIISTACDEGFGDRKALIDGVNGITNLRWNLKLFPNPTGKTLNIHSNVENEMLKIKILDLSGRLVYEQDVKVNGFLTTLELNLVNGAYFVHVQNQENKSLVQKLLIAK